MSYRNQETKSDVFVGNSRNKRRMNLKKLSFDELVRNDEHLIQDVPWELGGIPNIQDDDMGEAKAKLSIAKALSLPKTILKYKRKPQMTDEVGDP